MSELIECVDNLTAEDIIRRAARTANGVPFYINTMGLAGFCTEYQTVYDSLTTKPAADIAGAQNEMWCGLIEDGVYTKFDVFYMFAQTTNGGNEAYPNWMNPGTYDSNPMGFNPTFVALEGFTGLAGGNLTTNWNPFTNGVNYIRDSASVGFYSRTNLDGAHIEIGGLDAAGDIVYLITRNGNNVNGRINSTGGGTAANLDSRGMFILNRVLSTHQDVWRNKVRIANIARPSTAVPNIEIYMLAYNNNGARGFESTRQISMAYAGGGFTQTDVDNMTDRFETYMDSNGKGVIP